MGSDRGASVALSDSGGAQDGACGLTHQVTLQNLSASSLQALAAGVGESVHV